ncbi:MAG: AAA family ATPase, partial [Mycoplasmataceae bacterium]|nr:AAA family ATPase [Mycoplasmataceae bacterium]
ILYGPPGTGKTLLAKAVSGEAKVPFFQVSGSAFEDMLVGVGAKRVRDLFSKARKAAPAIIFIDEIDSVASKRGKMDAMGGGGLADQTINQLLAEMDGFSTKAGVIVIAATNRLDSLDEAILRPGRFDRHIQINLPDIREREEILKIHAKNKNISSAVSFTDIARRTPGMSGAELENVLNEATLLAVRFNKTTITMKEIDEGIDRVIAGPAKYTKVISPDEKRQIAVHEAGHALVGLYTPGSDIVEKITIIPRGMAAGYTVSNPEKQETQIKTKRELLSLVTALMGGRAAEEVEYSKDDVSTGASNDLYRASQLARAMVMQMGMSDVSIGQLIPSEGQQSPYAQKLYSESTAQKADIAVEELLQTEYTKAKEIIIENKAELMLIVETLLVLETIVKSQIDYIHKHKKMPEEAIKVKTEFKNDSKKED